MSTTFNASEGGTPEAQQLCANIFAMIQPEMAKLFSMEKARAKSFDPPKLTSKGLQAQAALNCKLLTALHPIADHEDPRVVAAVKTAMELLEGRNADLVLADSTPDGFRMVEKLEVIKGLGTSTQSPAQLLALTSLMAQPDRKRPREASPSRPSQPFRNRGSGYQRQPESRYNDEYESLVRENARLRAEHARPRYSPPELYQRNPVPSTSSPAVCHNCRMPGHFARDCRQRKF